MVYILIIDCCYRNQQRIAEAKPLIEHVFFGNGKRKRIAEKLTTATHIACSIAI